MLAGSSVILLSFFVIVALGGTVPARRALFKRAALPDYAITYAPYAYLYSGEKYFPSDISSHFEHTVPEIDFSPIASAATAQTLNSISADAFLTSIDDPNGPSPAWLTSIANKPDSTGYSAAPGTIIAVPKADGIVDVFYFYFFSFDLGNTVLGIRFGNHVGDWEHSMVRFVNGVPSYVWLSAHSGGSAYTYAGISKEGVHPKVFIAAGTHANYATSGTHDYSLPFSLLHDTTDAGFMWDMTKNYRGYWYDGTTVTSAGGAGIGGSKQDAEGVSWLYWGGRWGDEQYPDDDDRQYGIFGQYHYVSGPTGPLSKNLLRSTVCGSDTCSIQSSTLLSEASIVEVDDGIVYDEYLDEFNTFKGKLTAGNVTCSS